MVDNNTYLKNNTRMNQYKNKYSKVVSEAKEGCVQNIIDNTINRKGIKIDELNDWNKLTKETKTITNSNTKSKSNISSTHKSDANITPNDLYSPVINNEDLFKNKEFRTNKDAFNAKNNDLLKDYSVNTSMFSYQQNLNNCDKLDISVYSNSHISSNRSKTRRYRSNQSNPFNVIEPSIKPINERELSHCISPIERLDNKNDNECEFNDIDNQLLEAKKLFANLRIELDEVNMEMNNKEIEEKNNSNSNINDDSLEEINQQTINEHKELNDKENKSNMYIKTNKEKAKVDVKPIKEHKQINNNIDIQEENVKEICNANNSKLTDNKQVNVKKTNNTSTPLSIENYQYTTNVMVQPYHNPIPLQMQMNVQMPSYVPLQQPQQYQPQIPNSPNQMYNQPIMQYQPPFNPYMFYQYEPMNLQLSSNFNQNAYDPIDNIQAQSITPDQDKSSIAIKPKPKPQIPKKTTLIEPKNSKHNNIKDETKNTIDDSISLDLKTKPIETSYNHIHLLKQIKRKNKSMTPNPEIKQINKRPVSNRKKLKKKEIKEEQPHHNKIYTTMKQHNIIKQQSNNNKDRITSAKTSIAQSSNKTSTNNINSNNQTEDELKIMNELLQNHQIYCQKVAKIKETLNE